MTFHLTRRGTLLGLGAAVAIGRASLALAAIPSDRRFVVVILRGALDGMAAVVPYGDPALTALRGEILLPDPGQPDGLLDLGGFYGLHPSLACLHESYRASEALLLHAVAGPTRVRSHFEAQDCLESGADHRLSSGWLNRAVTALPSVAVKPEGDAMAFGVALPLLLRGPAPVGSWAPSRLGAASPDFYTQVAALAAGDRLIGPAIAQGLRERGYSSSVLPEGGGLPPTADPFKALATAAGEMLARPDGPRVAALELDGWDTHVAQPARLEAMLRQLDAGLGALRQALGPAWKQTAVLCMTEFGRTVRVNGNRGTDHGTGTVAFLLGGAVRGGKVRADWPGLGSGQLYENRDLAPTADLRAVAKGVLTQHLGVPATALARVFPDSTAVAPMANLIRVRA